MGGNQGICSLTILTDRRNERTNERLIHKDKTEDGAITEKKTDFHGYRLF